jgi:hypothetical protein
MRLFTLALPLAAALVLAVPATATRPPSATTEFTGTPDFVSTPSADGIHRDVTLTAPFTHKGSVAVQLTITANGALHGPFTSRTYRGVGSETFTWSITGTDGCFPPLPGDTISYHLQLVEIRGPSHAGAVLDEITTDTFVIT